MHSASWTQRRLALSGCVAAALAAPMARGNVVGGDLQNFNAVPGGIDYVTVQSAETLEPGYVSLGLLLNHAVNSLPYYQDSAQNRLKYNDSLTMADVGVGAGLAANLEAGLAVQYLIAQQVSNADHGEFSGPGITNYRLYSKYRLLAADGLGLAAVATVDFNTVRDNPLVGSGGSPVGVLELAADTKVHQVALAANAGYRLRKKGQPIPDLHLLPMGNQYIGSVGASYLLPIADTKLIAEIFGSRPAHSTATGLEARQSSSAEALVGLKVDWTSAVALHVGAGTELIRGSATPDWRVYCGLNWATQPLLHKPLAPERTLVATAQPHEERAVLHNIHFATGSDQVPAEAAQELTAVAKQIKASPYDKIVVEGHTDSVGRAAQNQLLSERRAATVRTWFIEAGGVDPGKIESVGFGDTRPIADNGNFQGRQRNRRVEVRVMRLGAVLRQTQDGPQRAPSPAAP